MGVPCHVGTNEKQQITSLLSGSSGTRVVRREKWRGRTKTFLLIYFVKLGNSLSSVSHLIFFYYFLEERGVALLILVTVIVHVCWLEEADNKSGSGGTQWDERVLVVVLLVPVTVANFCK